MLVDTNDPLDVIRAEEFRKRNCKVALGLDGTCTGEHGIGIGKKSLLIEELGGDTINLMRRIKKELDPNSILNPGKVFDLIGPLPKAQL